MAKFTDSDPSKIIAKSPPGRPKPSLQEIYDTDRIVPPAHMREESRVDMGHKDISVSAILTKAITTRRSTKFGVRRGSGLVVSKTFPM